MVLFYCYFNFNTNKMRVKKKTIPCSTCSTESICLNVTLDCCLYCVTVAAIAVVRFCLSFLSSYSFFSSFLNFNFNFVGFLCFHFRRQEFAHLKCVSMFGIWYGKHFRIELAPVRHVQFDLLILLK